MNSVGKCLLWGLILALVTGGLGYVGIRDWSGEADSANWLLYFGLPMIAVLLITRSWILGVATQAVVCVTLVGLVGAIYRRTRGRGPAETTRIGEIGSDPPTGRTADPT